MSGWVKLYRQSLDNPIVCKDSDHFSIWNYLLLKATHAEIDVVFSGGKITLQKGQLITGRKVIAKKFNISESKVQRVLKTLEIEQQIEQQTSNKNRLISILNWSLYQESEQQNEQQLNNNRTTTEQQLNTNKNVKNDKNDKNDKNGRNVLINRYPYKIGNIQVVSKEQIILPNGKSQFVDEKRYGGNGKIAFARANGKCEKCHTEEKLIIHHANNYSNDGDDLVILCRKCHSMETNNGNCPPDVHVMSNGCNQEIDIELEKEKEKEKKKNIKEFFDYWNTLDIIKHKKITDEMTGSLKKALSTFTLEEIKLTAKHYSTMLHDTSYEFCNYVWGIPEFFTRKEGYLRFMDDGGKWVSYHSNKVEKKSKFADCK